MLINIAVLFLGATIVLLCVEGLEVMNETELQCEAECGDGPDCQIDTSEECINCKEACWMKRKKRSLADSDIPQSTDD